MRTTRRQRALDKFYELVRQLDLLAPAAGLTFELNITVHKREPKASETGE